MSRFVCNPALRGLTSKQRLRRFRPNRIARYHDPARRIARRGGDELFTGRSAMVVTYPGEVMPCRRRPARSRNTESRSGSRRSSAESSRRHWPPRLPPHPSGRPARYCRRQGPKLRARHRHFDLDDLGTCVEVIRHQRRFGFSRGSGMTGTVGVSQSSHPPRRAR
jgi:hypothetical protein